MTLSWIFRHCRPRQETSTPSIYLSSTLILICWNHCFTSHSAQELWSWPNDESSLTTGLQGPSFFLLLPVAQVFITHIKKFLEKQKFCKVDLFFKERAVGLNLPTFMPAEIPVSSRLLIAFWIHETCKKNTPGFTIYVGYLLYCAPEYQKGKDFVVVFCYASRGGVQWRDDIIGSILHS